MYNGILNIYKEKGYTSHDVVAKLRGILGQKKIGHTGTLDPEAEGVLPVCLGNATKLCDILTEKDKAYECVMCLGIKTDTQDMTGNVIMEAEAGVIGAICAEEVIKTVKAFEGAYEQIPPMYSAVRINGKRLYEFAREGIEIERKSRSVIIHKIDILSIELPFVKFRAECSKGTYIRTLCNDIGEKLGCGAAMSGLVRIKSGKFSAADAITLHEAREYANAGCLEKYIISAESVLNGYGSISVKKEYDSLLYNGNSLNPGQVTVTEDNCTGPVRTYDSSGRFIALYEYMPEKKEYKNRKRFL